MKNFRQIHELARPGQACDVTKEQLMGEFPDIFDGKLRAMPGESYVIHVHDDAKPCCVLSPRRIPLACRDPLKKQLGLQHQGVIQPVTEPSEWCSPIIVVPKKNSDEVRLCVDFTQLNRFIIHEGFHSPTPHECVASIISDQAKFFSLLDALKGYHQCPVDPNSQAFTTFISPMFFGRSKFLRALFGVSSISEHFSRLMYEALEGLGNLQ